ncbi:hypothetical protein M2161_002248 [Streptomyces sp. SAI-133]|uniref:hypothetical protein n=1 Tax=unclassified Streptomyces TaxID=2593676 RepID=UPI0024735B6B|nr:hypothetical protein [Streptomyces sp. SAI-133]MDH6583142.1 hypothetical protein [Streptomyces sp. SAI-133]
MGAHPPLPWIRRRPRHGRAARPRGLDAIDTGVLLAGLPDSPDEAAAVCGFGPRASGDVRDHLVEHFDAMREFYREAARRGQCVVVWTD